MNINIYGSTGVIGRKTLELIDKNFPNIKINLLCAKSNFKLLKKQIHKYNPKYAFLYDIDKFKISKFKIGKTKILNFSELISYLSSSKSNLSILAISVNLVFSSDALPQLSILSLTSGSVFELRKLNRQSLKVKLKPSNSSTEIASLR